MKTGDSAINRRQIKGNPGSARRDRRGSGLKATILAKVKTTVVGVRAVRTRGGRLPNAWNIRGRLKRGKMQKTNGLKHFNEELHK